MATNKKITELTELSEADLSDDDVLPIVDISAGTTNKVRKSTLASALSGVSSITATTPIAVNQSTGAVVVSTGTIPITSGGTGQTNASAAISALGGFSDPTTTRGDLLSRGASIVGRVPIGSVNNVLKSDGTDPGWGLVATSELSGTINLTNQVSGILPTGNGGTGISAIGAAGQVLTVNSGGSGLEWAAGVTPSEVALDRFSGTGSQTAFTLSTAPTSENVTQLFISGVYQQKDTYSISGNVLTFNTAPPSGTDNIEITNTGASFYGVTASIGTVTTGTPGTSAVVSITGDGVLSFTLPRGDVGATGSTGSTGSTGAAASITAGTATGLSVGASPTVTNSGSSSAATFNFGIPVGATGATGSTGSAGSAATITVGSTTTGAAGSSASIVNSGSSSAATFDFTIPKGDTGATGSTGTAATIAAGTTTTGAAGSSASVANSGSSSAATFDFTIPKGDTGATGSTGATGTAATIAAGTATGLSAGASPTVTNSGSSSAATFNFGIPAGATGSTGSAATIAVGTTTTGAAGSSASVSNSGSSSAATFDFAIPKGDTGTTGTAATIAAGTATGLTVGSAPTVTNSGSSSAATFNFGIPVGATGATGSTGSTGAAATIAAGTATGLTVGSAPTVTNSGSSSAATFNFGIPVGATGATGATGSTGATGTAATIAVGTTTTGAAGSAATVTNVGSSSAATFNFVVPQGAAGTGSGDVTGPASSTDNAIARFDSTTGKLLQNSTVTVSDVGAVAAASLTLTTDLAIADGGTGSSTAGAALTALGAAASGANSDITSLTGLTTDLTVAQGGTGAGTFTANGLLIGNGTGAVTATAVGTATHVLTSNGVGVAPTFQAAGGGGATDIDGLSDAVTKSSGGTIGLGTGALVNDDGSVRNNTAVGYQAGNTLTDGYNNNLFGYQAGFYISSGYENNAIGYRSSYNVTTGYKNTGVGHRTFYDLTTGSKNTAIGCDSSKSLTTGSTNVAMGFESLRDLRTGIDNIAIGVDAGKNITTQSENVILGAAAGAAKLGTGNTLLGHRAGNTGATGNYNVYVGNVTGLNATGNNNTMMGYFAGYSQVAGTNNTIIGNGAAGSTTTISDEITLGNTAVTKFRIPGINFTVKDTVATEDYVLTVDANGEAGWEAAAGGATDIDGLSDGVTNSSGFTVGLGLEALSNDDGGSNKNTALGYQALKATNSNFQNTAVGYQAGTALIGTGDVNYGRDSSLFGYRAGALLTTGKSNTAVGTAALDAATTPDGNTAIGTEAGGVVTTGANNVFVGRDAGYTTTTGSNNIILGGSAQASSATVSNEITLGDTNITKFRVPGLNFNIKDSTATEDYVLTVDANGEAGWEAAGGGGGTWEVIANGSSLSAGTYTDISGYKYVKAIFGSAGSTNVGPSLSTSNSSNSGVSTSNGCYFRTTLYEHAFYNSTGAYSPDTSSLYYGNSIIPASTPHAFHVELFGLDQTNVGIRAGLEGAVGIWDNTTFICQTQSGSSNWYFYNNTAVTYYLIIGVS